MRVIEAQAARLGREPDTAVTMSRNVRRAFLGGAIDVGRHDLTMPMQLLGCIGLVENIYSHFAAFPEADQRAGELAIVRDRREDFVRRNFDGSSLDAHRVIGSRYGFSCENVFWRKPQQTRGKSSSPKELTPRVHHKLAPRQELPITMPTTNTQTPPTITWKAARRNGVSM